MSSENNITSVALAGKGRFGSVVLDELLGAGFRVTVLTRSAAGITGVPKEVKVTQVDYTSEESLRKAIQGHDAVVSTVAGAAVAIQKPLINAAISAGVKHFIPADYAMSLRSPDVRKLPPYTDVHAIEEYLEEKSGQMQWTIVACGGFLEYVFDLPFVVDFGNRKMDMVSGGAAQFSTSKFVTAAKAVAGVLRQPDRVKDHCVQVHAIPITQSQIWDIIKRNDKRLSEWTVTEQDGDAKFQAGLDMLKRGELTMEAVSTLMAGATWGGKYKVVFDETDNDWLGIETISEQELEEILKKKIEDGISSIASDTIVSDF
ncbi:unnamed protein product [Clonostachys solani]|uniref:NAD(P)-binding domain-containing protein n=1 Tax=Clonostachys solani TaxID=160281 RepID=A0A9N9Z8K9_9HYPO|nr:unnamed protein product [Clonostachys solani]